MYQESRKWISDSSMSLSAKERLNRAFGTIEPLLIVVIFLRKIMLRGYRKLSIVRLMASRGRGSVATPLPRESGCRNASPRRGKRWLTALLLLASAAPALAQTTLSEKLVTRYSSRWNEIQGELSYIAAELETLPGIPLADLGGTGGMVSYTWYQNQNDELDVFVRWDKAAAIDLVVLVPARKFSSDGLEPEFGLPNFIEIELLDGNDNPVHSVAREHAASARPIKKGFPFVYSLPTPVQAHGARIRCRTLKVHEFVSGPTKVLALAELFCFSGQRNVAAGAEVRVVEDNMEQVHWFWRAPFLVDELTSLGLPETPVPDLQHMGWVSETHASEDTGIAIDLEFDRPVKLDGIRMFPVVHTSSGYPPGFAFPQRFRLVAFDEGFVRPIHVMADHSEQDLVNPGHNPATFRFPETTAQHIRLECSRIWKNFPNYPAFLAFSEIQLLHGETNLAAGVAASPSEALEVVGSSPTMVWSRESLTNGYGPEGKLVSRREWLLLLDQRFGLETRQQALLMEAENRVATLRTRLLRTFG